MTREIPKKITDKIEEATINICEHLMNKYEPPEAISISISVMMNMVMHLDTHSKNAVLANLYHVIDDMKFGDVEDIEINLH